MGPDPYPNYQYCLVCIIKQSTKDFVSEKKIVKFIDQIFSFHDYTLFYQSGTNKIQCFRTRPPPPRWKLIFLGTSFFVFSAWHRKLIHKCFQNGDPIYLRNVIPICFQFFQNVNPIFFFKMSILSFFAKWHSYLFLQNVIPIFFCQMSFLSFLQNVIPITCLQNAISTFFAKCNSNLFCKMAFLFFLQNFIPISCLLNAISTFFSKCNFNLFLQNVVPIFFCKVSILSFFAKCHSYLLLAKCNFYLFLQNVIPTFFCKMAFLSFCLKLFQYFLQIVLPIFFCAKSWNLRAGNIYEFHFYT